MMEMLQVLKFIYRSNRMSFTEELLCPFWTSRRKPLTGWWQRERSINYATSLTKLGMVGDSTRSQMVKTRKGLLSKVYINLVQRVLYSSFRKVPTLEDT